MSTFNSTPAVEGDPLTAANLNAKAGTELETPVNALDESSIERYALSEQHLPDMGFSSVFTSGYEAGAPSDIQTDVELVYDNGLPLTTANTAFPYTYQTFDTNTDATSGAISIYGSTDTLALAGYATNPKFIYDGWRIPASHQSTTDPAEVALASATNFDTANISGVICRGGVEPLYSADATNGAASAASNLYIGATSVALAIGWTDSTANSTTGAGYHIVERSVRFYSVAACKRGNAGTFTYLTQDDLDVGDGTCASVFLAVACVRPGDINAARTGSPYRTGDPEHYYDHLLLRAYNISVTPIRAGSLT
jgi:hypothetical protein